MNDDYRTAAVGALADREYRAAGDAYARAGWSRLAEPRDDRSPFDADEKGWVGRALARLAVSALSYRVAGLDDRAEQRAREGIAVASDLEHALTRPVQRACLQEFAADFRVIGGLAGTDESYDEAETRYREAAPTVESPQTVTTTPLFRAAVSPLKQVARGLSNGEIAVSWDDVHGSDPDDVARFLAHRVAFKRQRYPTLVERAVDSTTLAAPRGTTEYNNASFRCPNCSSTDVNWVADYVLCLRCSTPMVDR